MNYIDTDTVSKISYLKEFRKKKGLTQKQLSDITGVNLRMIQGYEQGTKDINKASYETVFKICVVLDIQFFSLLDFNDELKEYMKILINNRFGKNED